MTNRGRGRRGGGRSNNPRPSAFDQQAFIEVISVMTATIAHAIVMAATIAQASAIQSQEGQVTSRGSRHTILQPLGEERI